MENANITVFEGKITKGDRTGQTYEAIRIEIGEWSQLIFPKTKFELNYIKGQLGIKTETK